MSGKRDDSRPSHEILIRGISFDHIATFRAVVEGGSFRRAAEKRLISQPAVSQRIRQLEALVGVPLFDRQRGTSAQLTSAGQLMLAFADRVLEELTGLSGDIGSLARQSPPGTITVASGPSFIKYYLLSVARDFTRLFPDVDVQLKRSVSPDDVMRAVLDHRADLGVYSGPVPIRKVRSFPLGSERLRLVAAPGHPITRRTGAAALEQLSQAAFAMSCDSAHSRQLTDAWARHYGVQLRVKIEADNLDTLKEAVLQGIALSILPEFAIQEELANGELREIALPGLPMQRQLSVIAEAEPPLSAAERALTDLLARAVAARRLTDGASALSETS